MSWYKKAKNPHVRIGAFRRYDSDEINTELDVYIDGEKKTYYGVNSIQLRQFEKMEKKPSSHGSILNMLRPHSKPELHQDDNASYTSEEEQMLSELPSQKELWGDDGLV